MVKQALKRVTPPLAWYAGKRTYTVWREFLARLSVAEAEWLLSPKRARSVHRLNRFKDRHLGQRCFIIGNGPSLRQMDLQPLRNEYTFGMNRIYLMFPELGFTTTYFVSVNQYVLEQCIDDIAALKIPKFLPWRHREYVRFDAHTMLLRTNHPRPQFSKDPRRWLHESHTVTFVAMQLAYFMGFQQVILIGVDHNFESKGPPNQLIVSEGDDKDHFNPNYFGRGFRWQLPDLEKSERGYRMARETFAAEKREILDATVGGKLTIFPKVEYTSLFDPGSARNA
jgi:hypothetical protein